MTTSHDISEASRAISVGIASVGVFTWFDLGDPSPHALALALILAVVASVSAAHHNRARHATGPETAAPTRR